MAQWLKDAVLFSMYLTLAPQESLVEQPSSAPTRSSDQNLKGHPTSCSHSTTYSPTTTWKKYSRNIAFLHLFLALILKVYLRCYSQTCALKTVYDPAAFPFPIMVIQKHMLSQLVWHSNGSPGPLIVLVYQSLLQTHKDMEWEWWTNPCLEQPL